MQQHPVEIKFASSEEAVSFYKSLVSSGYANIAGLDECGRGPYAGPVVAACVLLPENHGIKGIKDSKKLSPRRREELSEQIMAAARWGIGVRDCKVVDSLNIRVATYQAAADASLQCLYSGAPIDFLLCDGGLHLGGMVPFPTTAAVKGDLWFECIGAASIIAKVYRDRQMLFYHDVWPEYGFKTNQGYGTKAHLKALAEYGMSPIHRRSFGVCKTAMERKDGPKERYTPRKSD